MAIPVIHDTGYVSLIKSMRDREARAMEHWAKLDDYMSEELPPSKSSWRVCHRCHGCFHHRGRDSLCPQEFTAFRLFVYGLVSPITRPNVCLTLLEGQEKDRPRRGGGEDHFGTGGARAVARTHLFMGRSFVERALCPGGPGD